MDSGTNMPRLYLFLLRLLQCSVSLIIIIIELLRHTGSIYLIESKMDAEENYYELFFEYCVMNLGFVTSALYIFRFNQRWKQGPYKYDILIDCVLMNAWMIFGILRLSPEFDKKDVLNCSQYENKARKGCVTYVSTLVLAYFNSASYFFTAVLTTWLWIRKKSETNTNTESNNVNNPNSNINNSNINSNNINSNRNIINNNNCINNTNNNNNSNITTPKTLSLAKLSKTKNSQVAPSEALETIRIKKDGRIINSETCAEISVNEFIAHNKHLAHLFNEDSEFDRSEGSIVIFCKPTPQFLKNEQSHRNSSLYENSINSKYISEYSLDSSFSRTYGSIIIPRKYTTQSETDNSTNSMLSKYDGSIIIGRCPSLSTFSDSFSSCSSNRLSSSFSDVTSRSSKYDGSIIIKLVT